MSIFIKGLDLPEKIEPELVIEFAEGINGKRYVRLHHYKIGSLTDWCEVVPVPPHGDLIDRDALEDMELESCDTDDDFRIKERVAGRNHIRRLVKDAPTIIPAEEDGEEA